MNSDEEITDDDVTCVRSFLSGASDEWLTCLECDENIPSAARHADEICNDGWDNNCDGLTDDDDPRCKCNAQTPCGLLYDADGGSSLGVDDKNFKLCRHLDWEEIGFRWVTQEEITCKEKINCNKITCAGQTFTCSGKPVKWYSAKLPKEVCQDGWDNDCHKGDAVCEEDDDDDDGFCLYVYSVSEDGMEIDHLAYPFSIMPSMEAYTFGTMSHLKPIDGSLTIRLSEELPEITNVNVLRLFAVDHPSGEVVPDQGGTLHTLSQIHEPLTCTAKDGTDCRGLVSKEDNLGYLYDLEAAVDSGEFDIRDELVLEFPKPLDASKIKILLKGKETGIVTYAWWSILEKVGRNNMDAFLAGVGNDPIQSLLFEQFANNYAKITLQLWDGEAWTHTS